MFTGNIDQKFLIALIVGLSCTFIIVVISFFIYIKNDKKLPKNKKIGNDAEEKINKLMKTWALNNNSKYIPSSLFKYENNLFEVDGILISPRALIVIEVKSINGIIEGDCTEEKWFKILGTRRHEINSPVMQNERHISHILEVIGTKIPILSMIIFDDRTEDIRIKNNQSHVIVASLIESEKILDEITKILLPKINNNEIHEIYSNLKNCSTNTKKDMKKFKDFFKNN